MESIKKAFKKMLKELKNFDKNLNYVATKSNQLGLILFWDILWCKLRYGVTSNEYRIFEFYRLDYCKRNTFMSKRRYDFLNDKLVNKKIINTLTNKETFNKKFKDYLKREVEDINNLSFKQTEDAILESKYVIGRSKEASFISSYREYDLKDYRSPAFLAEAMKENKDYLIEPKFKQHKELNKINPLVFVNIVSVYNRGPEIVSSTIKFRDGKELISGYVDLESKCIVGNFKDENGQNYKDNFNGFEIPKLSSVIEIVKLLSEELKEIRQVEWTFIIGSKQIYLLDGNVWDDYVFSQIPEFLKNDEGLMTYYKKF